MQKPHFSPHVTDVTLLSFDDWQILYIDGRPLEQGHSLHLGDVIQRLSKVGPFTARSGFIDFRDDRRYDEVVNKYGHALHQILSALTADERAQLDF